ncbi:MAG: NUDIX domain-containing protein [Acidimicrobiales bacterium]|jgi:8-oxo-dGTP pyrophosphatase MutT (NUDIX family)|nr:NUDIX domain-containing protein [Acidimicrobiales bacterium]
MSPGTGAGDELVDVVDGSGTVIGVASRRVVRAHHLPHRAVFVAVVHEGRVVVHQRAPWKDVWPGAWDLAFGGVVGAGESWDDAAARELAEEAGVEAGLTAHGGDRWWSDGVDTELARVYVAEHPGPFPLPDGEVVATDWVPVTALDAWGATTDVVPDSWALVRPVLQALHSSRVAP